MNLILVLNLVSVILLLSSIFMILPFGVSIYYGGEDTGAIGLTFILTLGSGLVLYFLTKSGEKVELKHRDGFLVVTLSWLVLSVFGSLPYMLSGTITSFTDAYFESMAGFTTTGASVLSNLEEIPRGVLFWRSLTQWMGGMGIIVFSLAILPMLGTGGMQLFKAEVPDIGVEKLKPRIIDMSKHLWYIYAGITGTLVILLIAGGMSVYDALCHAFTTMATGGFSTRSQSIGTYNSAYIDIVITIFMFIAGVNFSLHFYAVRGKISRFAKNSEFKFYCSVLFIAVVIISLSIMKENGYSLLESLRYAVFQVVSITTTTGYVTADYEKWPFVSQMILLVLMFFGGMVGSTGGGMKQVRILLMLKQAYREIYHLIHPHAVSALRLDEKNVPKTTLGGIWGFLFLYILIVALATILMTALDLDLITAASTVISSISNVGPALGLAGPTENYAMIPDAGKWILALCMLTGRLEIYTVIVLFMPIFWRK